MDTVDTHDKRQLLNKAMLYCPDCGHENRINGDWHIHVLSARVDYECPECGEKIESRSDGSDVITHV